MLPALRETFLWYTRISLLTSGMLARSITDPGWTDTVPGNYVLFIVSVRNDTGSGPISVAPEPGVVLLDETETITKTVQGVELSLYTGVFGHLVTESTNVDDFQIATITNGDYIATAWSIWENVGSASAVTNHGDGTPAATGTLNLASSEDDVALVSQVLYPRRNIGTPYSFPDPPFNTLMGNTLMVVSAGTNQGVQGRHMRSGTLQSGAAFGPYNLGTFDEIWTTALVAMLPPPSGPADPAEFQPDRIASSFFETAGDILARVPQSDVSANEVVPLLEQLNIGDIVNYVTITRPERVIKRFRVSADLPQSGPKRNYRYRTLKGLLGGIYPDSTFGTTQQLLGKATATAQEIVQYVLNQWNARHGMNFGTVPPLYLFIPDANGDYTETLESDVIAVRQPNRASRPLEPRRSMQQLLEAMLSAFPGYKLVITSDDELVIRSPWWSSAYDRTTLTLGEDDVIAPLPRASLDDSEVRNVWSVTTTQYGFVDDQDVIAPSYTRASFVDSGYTPAGREFASFATYRDTNGDPLIVDGPVTVDWTHRVYAAIGQLNNRSGTIVLQPNVTTELVVNMDLDGVRGDVAWLNLRHTSSGLSVRITQAASSTWLRTLDHFFEYDASGSTWGETGTEQIRYGEGRDRLAVPGLGTSQAVYGVREGSITTEFFTVDTLQAVRLARSLARWFMNPRAKYTDVGLTTRAEVGPEDIWRLTTLPNDAVTVMESYRYMDSRTIDSLMARTSASFEFLFDLEGSVSEPAGSGEDVALGADGASWYAN